MPNPADAVSGRESGRPTPGDGERRRQRSGAGIPGVVGEISPEAALTAEAEAGGGVPMGGDPLMPAGAGEAAPPPLQLQALGKSALLFAGAAIASKAVSFVMLPLYTRYLSPADYGAIELIELSLDIITIAAGSRLLGGVFRFYYKATSDSDRSAVISTAIWTVCLGYAIIGCLAFFGAPLIARFVLGADRYTGLVRLGALSAATSAPTFVPTPHFRVQGRFRLIVGAQLSRLGIQVALNIVLLTVAHLGARSMFISTIVANVCLGSVLVVMALRDVGVRYAPHVAADLYRFGLPLVATQVATFILTFGDRYFLRKVATLDAVGRYTLAYQFAFLLAMLAQTPFEMVWDPKRHEVAKRPDRDSIYARMFVYQNVVLLSSAVAIALFVRVTLQVLTPPAFWGAADVVPILLAAIILQSWSASQDIGIIISERTKWIAAANWAGAITVLVAYALLIPRMAAWGAAIATVIGYAVRYGGIYAKAQQLWPVRYNWTPIRRLTALATAAVVVGVLLPAGPLAFAIVSRACLFVLYLLLAWRLPILTDDERNATRELAAKLLGAGAGLIRARIPEDTAT
jgi:O-antigen/teichoic acid export membrane protein